MKTLLKLTPLFLALIFVFGGSTAVFAQDSALLHVNQVVDAGFGSNIPGRFSEMSGSEDEERDLPSNKITHNFIAEDDSNRRLVTFVLPLLLLIIGGRLLTSWIANRGQKEPSAANFNGPAGGTICPKCHKPFARHMWAPNLISGKYDRCPHCHKWSFVTRVHPDVLQASYEAMVQAEKTAQAEVNPPEKDDENTYHSNLDDSRFDS